VSEWVLERFGVNGHSKMKQIQAENVFEISGSKLGKIVRV
jgi:hypothetical protein